MAFMQSQKAEKIIADYLDKPYEKPPAINPIFDLREPGQEFPPLNPPVTVDPDIDPCPAGYQLIDGICQPIDEIGGGSFVENTTGDGFEDTDTRTESQKMFDDMKKDTSNMFGATNFMDKYEIGEDEFGNPLFQFDPKKGVFPFFGIPFIDALTGGGKRREEKFNQAINTILSQTQNQDMFGNTNPLAFGRQDGDIFKMFNPEQYLKNVQDVAVNQVNNQDVTIGDMLGSLNTGTASQVQSQGTEPVDVRGSSLVITDDGVRRRDDTAYQSEVAKNIARNISNTGSSGFSTTLGGFTRGR
tara:strand:+ start:597 stop:1496 length:900 start_codon:yes stop_codon:yes gene_type:complete